MDFSIIADQPTAVRTLQSAIEKNRVAHAYLFIGPSGVGRKLTARVLAAALNCEGTGDAFPCGVCSSCRLVAEGRHPDVQTIMPSKRSSTIAVEQIEALLPSAYLRPLKGKRKVFIISEADRLGLASANKLLKTLEEPPPSSVFVLVTERPENMLPTVASRCQPVKFSRLHAQTVQRILTEDFHVDPARAAVAAELADGQVTRGLQFADPERFEAVMNIFDSLDSCSGRLKAYDRILEVLSEERTKLQDRAEEEISAGGEELTSAIKHSLEDARKSFVDMNYRAFLNDCLGLLLTFYRDILVLRETGIEKFVVNRHRISKLREMIGRLNPAAILDNIKYIEEASTYTGHYVGEDRVLLDLLLRLRSA